MTDREAKEVIDQIWLDAKSKMTPLVNQIYVNYVLGIDTVIKAEWNENLQEVTFKLVDEDALNDRS